MNRKTTRARGLAALLATAVLLAQGCSGLLTSEQAARQYYLLAPLREPVTPTTEAPPAHLALQVSAIPGLDTDQLLALGTDARLQQYSNARWPDHLPEVLTSTLQRSLESSGRFTSVDAADRTDNDGWLLGLEVREFFGIRDAAGNTGSVRVALAGAISCGGQRHPLKLSSSQIVSEQRLATVVAAHQAGLDAVTKQLIERIAQTCMAGAKR
jgi:ABC-type uncharacterized transport system auxiliary subunit